MPYPLDEIPDINERKWKYVHENPDANYSEEEKAWMIKRKYEDWKLNWTNFDSSPIKQNDECVFGFTNDGCFNPRIVMNEMVFLGYEGELKHDNLSMYCKEHGETISTSALKYIAELQEQVLGEEE